MTREWLIVRLWSDKLQDRPLCLYDSLSNEFFYTIFQEKFKREFKECTQCACCQYIVIPGMRRQSAPSSPWNQSTRGPVVHRPHGPGTYLNNTGHSWAWGLSYEQSCDLQHPIRVLYFSVGLCKKLFTTQYQRDIEMIRYFQAVATGAECTNAAAPRPVSSWTASRSSTATSSRWPRYKRIRRWMSPDCRRRPSKRRHRSWSNFDTRRESQIRNFCQK